ncbi:MAG: aspartate aminotransferase family protein [Brevundimonas sp.]|jgi:acetylornithine/N-succinyldiaminopimelate aminotransferase|uniref:aspartate aminotransferase family protein n=1 Tax=Brevundimonas sp. TaxID=1871086 RepID=UPI0022BEA38B|nr:aspartate aminotransferase family protein [Brevundimonas sp.]MCZ8085796.1 aspartate aminotransferase family protein [Brevundimonas sp.]MCZ8195079.1 aspartate aminotransferase family protein [Brevundimonas sp.]
MGVYNRAPLEVERGEGARLYATDGTAYLDCVAGIATNALGHAHPRLVEAVKAQADKLWHVSNIFRIPGQEELADRLCADSFADVVFFTNSGTEAVECALKTARKYHTANGQPERVEIYGFDGAFHGRSYAAINAAGNPGYVEGFGPRLPGYTQLTFGDHDALEAAIANPTTAAIIVEPVQGEGGARAIPESCLRSLRELCDRHGVLIIFDEVQCGMGRTGKLWAHQWAGMAPDIMAVAKALGGGFPVGACLASAEAARGMTVGVHGSTFGGNPLAMAVGLAAYDEISKPETLAHVNEVAGYLKQQLHGLKERFPEIIVDIRGKGLLIGVKLVPNNREFMALAREGQHLLVAGGGDNCVRLLPPLTLTLDEAREVISKLERTCEAARSKMAA